MSYALDFGRLRTLPAVALLVTACLAGCADDASDHAATPPTPQGSAVPSAATEDTSASPVPLKPPAVTAGELARTVVSERQSRSTLHRLARPSTVYGLQLACTATTSNLIVDYEVFLADTVTVKGTMPCGAPGMLNEIGKLAAQPVRVDLGTGTTGLTGVTSAYAIVAPMSELHP